MCACVRGWKSNDDQIEWRKEKDNVSIQTINISMVQIERSSDNHNKGMGIMKMDGKGKERIGWRFVVRLDY